MVSIATGCYDLLRTIYDSFELHVVLVLHDVSCINDIKKSNHDTIGLRSLLMILLMWW